MKKIGNEELWTNPDPLAIWEEEKKLIGTRRELVLKAIWSKAQDGDLSFIMILERLGSLESK